jgi:hypothetical protein
MTSPDQDLLTTTEGVDEGSAASTAEGAGTGTGGGSARTAESRPHEDAAAPVDMESEQSRAARDAAGTGQQLQAGEG